jgi:hypothetical protein
MLFANVTLCTANDLAVSPELVVKLHTAVVVTLVL